jgi:hypothetical protein
VLDRLGRGLAHVAVGVALFDFAQCGEDFQPFGATINTQRSGRGRAHLGIGVPKRSE